jgi:hypothetical protein
MEITKINLLSIPAYEFYATPELTQEVYLQVLDTPLVKNINNQISSDNFHNRKLIRWFNECLLQVKNLYFADQLNLKVTACWVNKSTKLQHHHLHWHPNSIVSGLFYLDDSVACTEYYIDDPYLKLNTEGLLGIGKNKFEQNVDNSIKSTIKPSKGKLLLWPSIIKHKTEVHTESAY